MPWRYKQERSKAIREMSKLEDNHQDEDEEYSHQQTLAVECEQAGEDPEKEYLDLKSSVVCVKREMKSKVDKLVQFRKAGKIGEDSVYSGIDLILLHHQIRRAAYTMGGISQEGMFPFSWRMLMRLCSKSVHIFYNQRKPILHVDEPTEDDRKKARNYIDKALALMRKLNMSVTVKGHGAEYHLVHQIRMEPGGLFEFNESWGEQAHQLGYNSDMRLRNQWGEDQKAKVWAANARRECKPQTQQALWQVKEWQTGKRKSTLKKEELKKQVKAERREKYLH
ncbi:hypothetical protein ACHAWF_000904 [Thalassiosira exigua]